VLAAFCQKKKKFWKQLKETRKPIGIPTRIKKYTRISSYSEQEMMPAILASLSGR
jgi:hypothetical protein